MATQHEVKGGPWTTGDGTERRAGPVSAGPATPDEREDAAGISISEVLHLLGRRGYVRSFEPEATELWCRSSETRFDPTTMVVESVTAVTGATVLALRDTVSGVAGTWILVERSGRERPLLARLTWSPSATPIRRPAGSAAPTYEEVPFGRTA